ncbi:MAG: class I tRNA ligase family protein, partial [Candidatus Puniceispirillaceae bacterium]
EDIFAYVMQQFAVLLSVFSPHIAEEIWEMTGGTSLVCQASWPVSDPHWLKSDMIEVAVQVNGKLRARIELPADCPAKEAEEKALALEGVERYLEGKPPKRVIVVPNRIINVVC